MTGHPGAAGLLRQGRQRWLWVHWPPVHLQAEHKGHPLVANLLHHLVLGGGGEEGVQGSPLKGSPLRHAGGGPVAGVWVRLDRCKAGPGSAWLLFAPERSLHQTTAQPPPPLTGTVAVELWWPHSFSCSSPGLPTCTGEKARMVGHRLKTSVPSKALAAER